MGGVSDKYPGTAEGLNRTLYIVMLCTDKRRTNPASLIALLLLHILLPPLSAQSILLS